MDLKVPMSDTGGTLQPRECDVELGMPSLGSELQNAEGLAHLLNASVTGEKGGQFIHGNAGHQQVFVLMGKAHHGVPKGSPHFVDTAAFFFDALQEAHDSILFVWMRRCKKGRIFRFFEDGLGYWPVGSRHR
jgi:hypothetical protein